MEWLRAEPGVFDGGLLRSSWGVVPFGPRWSLHGLGIPFSIVCPCGSDGSCSGNVTQMLGGMVVDVPLDIMEPLHYKKPSRP